MINAEMVCGASPTATFIADELSRSRQPLHESQAFGIECVLREELAEVWEDCRQSNWDGYNAFPVTQDAPERASQMRLLRAHEILSELSEENHDRFSTVVNALRAELRQDD